MAAAFDNLAHDVDAGHVPQPRCSAEAEALQIVLAAAPELLSASDDQLRQLGVTAAFSADEYEHTSPDWEQAWYCLVPDEDLEYTIAEALLDDDAGDEPPGDEPADIDWAGMQYWFSAFTVFPPRLERPHPQWVSTALEFGLTTEDSERADHAAQLLRLGAANPWSAYCDGYSGYGGALGEVLTDNGAKLLATAAHELADIGYREIGQYGDEPFEREGYDQFWTESVLGRLPSVCDRQNGAWRLAMIRSFSDLADDLESGRAPLPRCNAEEIALHLILNCAEQILDELGDDEVGVDWGLPDVQTFSGRHRQFWLMREAFFQDDDVLMHYDQDMADVACDPDEFAMRYLAVGDIRPPTWWQTFANLTPRLAGRGFNAHALSLMGQSHLVPVPVLHPADRAENFVLAPTLAEEFETFVGLAQRRFFDPACAVAMARSFATLLTAYLDTPELNIHLVWSVGRRARAADGETLLFDPDFALAGHTQLWRLRSDMSDADARAWAITMLADCGWRVVELYASAAPEVMLYESDAVPLVDPPEIFGNLGTVQRNLSRATTLGRFLVHRRIHLGISVTEVATAALLPASTIVGWEAGAPADAGPLIRCAPVLQLSETVLLRALQGHRASGWWPLPEPEATSLEY